MPREDTGVLAALEAYYDAAPRSAALVVLLAVDALDRGAQLVFLSAGDATVARVYERLGFRRVGTACTAEPPAG